MEKARISKLGVPYLHFGKGVPLVLIHGLGEVKEGWADQFELADQYELIIPDLRGHGECNKSAGISIQNFAADIISLLKEIEIENAHILDCQWAALLHRKFTVRIQTAAALSY
jgi:pimeloyl-ACP methyl ester carboxylesterase